MFAESPLLKKIRCHPPMDVTSYFGYILTHENAIYNYFDFKIFKSNFYSFTSLSRSTTLCLHICV